MAQQPPDFCRDANGNCTAAIDADGGPVQCVGEWALTKQHYIRGFFEATGGVRRKFNETGSRAGSVYLDMFAANGRARVREIGSVIDGTALRCSQSTATTSPSPTLFCVNSTTRMPLPFAVGPRVTGGFESWRVTATCRSSG